MDCKACKANQTKVSLISVESERAAHERTVKRLLVVIAILIVSAFSVIGFMFYEFIQFDYVDEKIETIYQQDGEGTNIIGDNNAVDNKVDNGAEKNS